MPRSLKFTGKPKKHFDGGGVRLLVTATGSTLWRMVYHFDKKIQPHKAYWTLWGCMRFFVGAGDGI